MFVTRSYVNLVLFLPILQGINYWYSIHFSYVYCSYTKNIMKYLGISSKILIGGAVSLTSTKDM